MELRQLRHFLALAEEMHFGRAAKRLCITQPALSASIQHLEEDFGVRLFMRDSKAVSITPDGELMLQRTREMLSQSQRTEAFARSLAAGMIGQIEVGYSGTVLHCGIDRILAEFRRAHPRIEIIAREITTPQQSEMLHTGRLDAGLMSLPLPPADLEHIELYEDRVVACVPAAHRLASNDVIDLAELRSEPFVIQSREIAQGFHDQIMGLCAAAGFEPRVAFHSYHPLSTIWLVSRGLGVALVLEALSNAGIGDAVFVPLNVPLLRRRGYFVWNRERKPAGLQLLIDSVHDFVGASRRV